MLSRRTALSFQRNLGLDAILEHLEIIKFREVTSNE